jgi:hypothetical protein
VTTEQRLALLRGGQVPEAHSARTIAALASNPGCARRAVLDAAGVKKARLAAYAGFPAPFGMSPFAITRGNRFESTLKSDPGGELLALLRQALDLDIAETGFVDLNDVGGSRDPALRYRHTRHKLTAGPGRRATMFDHPLLRFRVGGRHAYLEPDLIAFRHDDTFHVVELKSFAVIDGQADGAKVAAAAIQSAVFVRALRDLVDGSDLAGTAAVHHETVLIAPRDFSLQPVAQTLDVRRQLGVLDRQLARIGGIDTILARVPGDVSFSLDEDDRRVPRRDPDELADDIRRVPASYAPECLAACEMCFLCRDEARGATGALGTSVREDVGGIETVAKVLDYAYAKDPYPVPEEVTEAAASLRRAAALRREALGGCS